LHRGPDHAQAARIRTALRSRPGGLQLRKVTVAQRGKLGALWMIVGEGGVAQAGGLAHWRGLFEALGAAR
jgi:hypothetical protein